MHGGAIYIRGELTHLGKEVGVTDLNEGDYTILRSLVDEFCNYFELDAEKILENKFNKLYPVSSRPYGELYAY